MIISNFEFVWIVNGYCGDGAQYCYTKWLRALNKTHLDELVENSHIDSTQQRCFKS